MIDCIDLHLGISCTLNEWRFLFDSHFDALRSFLSPTGQRASAWCCPFNGRKQEISEEEGKVKAVSSDCKCSPCVEANNIPPADLELWNFCPSIFAHCLSPGLGLHADPKLMKKGVLHLGSLASRSIRLSAFLLNYNDTSYQLRAQAIMAKQTGTCIIYTPRYCHDLAEWIGKTRHGYFPLEDLLLPGSLDPSPTYWQELQKFKSSLSIGQPNLEEQYKLELSHQMAEGFDSIRRERVEDIVAILTKQKTIEEMAESPDKFVSGLVARMNDQVDIQLFFLLRVKVEAEGKNRALSYSEIGMKLDISKQAVGVRVIKFKERNPEAWAFLDPVRNPKSEVPFSGLSPSERRKEGIDEAYNYDAG